MHQYNCFFAEAAIMLEHPGMRSSLCLCCSTFTNHVMSFVTAVESLSWSCLRWVKERPSSIMLLQVVKIFLVIENLHFQLKKESLLSIDTSQLWRYEVSLLKDLYQFALFRCAWTLLPNINLTHPYSFYSYTCIYLNIHNTRAEADAKTSMYNQKDMPTDRWWTIYICL